MLLKEGQIWQVLSLLQELTLDTWKPEEQGNAIVVRSEEHTSELQSR